MVAVVQTVDLVDGLESGQPIIAENVADDLEAATLERVAAITADQGGREVTFS